MMRLTLLVLLACSIAAAPATKSTTAPARVRDSLINGSVRFLVPASWEATDRGEEGLSVAYILPEDQGKVSILINQQEQGIPQRNAAYRQLMIKIVVGTLTEDLKTRNVEILEAPKVENDDRFMLKVHERFKENEKVIDVVHIYRGLGLNFIGVTVASTLEDKARLKAVQDAAGMLLMSVTLGPPDPKLVRPKKQG